MSNRMKEIYFPEDYEKKEGDYDNHILDTFRGSNKDFQDKLNFQSLFGNNLYDEIGK